VFSGKREVHRISIVQVIYKNQVKRRW